MDIYEKIVRLLVANGNVSEEKVEQARKLAESLVWDGEVRPTRHALDGGESADLKAESTPEVLSTSQALPKPTRRK